MVRLVRCPKHRPENTKEGEECLIPGRVTDFEPADIFGGYVTFTSPKGGVQYRYACCVKKVGVQYTINICR